MDSRRFSKKEGVCYGVASVMYSPVAVVVSVLSPDQAISEVYLVHPLS